LCGVSNGIVSLATILCRLVEDCTVKICKEINKTLAQFLASELFSVYLCVLQLASGVVVFIGVGVDLLRVANFHVLTSQSVAISTMLSSPT
jgi:hypothetical protein